jgi:hypothetical protein
MRTSQVILRFVFVALFVSSIPLVVRSDELSEQTSGPSTSSERQPEKRLYSSLDEAKSVARQLGRPIMAVFR